MKNNLFSVFCIQGGEQSGIISMALAEMFSEKIKKKVVYIPVGINFEYEGTISLTELYFNFLKNRDYIVEKKGLTVVKPFNCFLETEEISDEEYFRFITEFSGIFDIAVLNLSGTSPGRFKRFIENSMVTAVLINCTQNDYSGRYTCFLKNLKLAWGSMTQEFMQNFIYILQGSNLKDISKIEQLTISETGINEDILCGKIFETEDSEGKMSKSVFKKWR